MIYCKRVRRQCGMRGCRNTDTYSLSHFNESAAANIIICKDCLKAALEAVENCKMPPVEYGRKAQSTPPPLFHNAIDSGEKVTAESTETESVEEQSPLTASPAKAKTRKKATGKADKA